MANDGVLRTDLDETSVGTTQIANEVIAVIAGLAATEVPGVADMSGGLVGGIAERLGRKNLSKGVKVEVAPDERKCNVELSFICEYGYRIPDVARTIQGSVKEAIEGMTGLDVTAVNVHVLGVAFRPEERTQDEETE
jgi:uncharacterized alkaline shock family protein YloU